MEETMTVIIENPDLVPLCPHCKAPLNEIDARTIPASGSSSFQFGKRYIYACKACNKALGITHRKGFWAG